MEPALTDTRPHIARGMLDLDAEVAYWRDYYARATPGLRFDACEPAIRLGIQACLHAHGRCFEEMDAELGRHYEMLREGPALEWTYARAVARAAWLRVAQPPAAAPE